MGTTHEWRVLDAKDHNRIECIGIVGEPRCHEFAVWCMQWQSDQMAAPAFWYFCATHRARQVDRIVLEYGDLTSRGCQLEAAALLRSAARDIEKAAAYLRQAKEVT
jgi:hypothetical protein